LSEDTLAFAVGATYMAEERKGFHLVPGALREIAQKRKCVVLQFGSGEAETRESWPCPVRRVGVCRTEQQVADLYRAADICLLPSLQDNLPNVALESLACGCPIVGFVPSGLSDIVADGYTGKFSSNRTSAGLAQAIDDWLAVAPSRVETSARCRASSESKYDMDCHAAAMMRLYANVLRTDERGSVQRLEKELIA
jgi:glycosyltransferase involved in cell wall biosynthesis